MASFILIDDKPLMYIPEELYGNQYVDGKLHSHYAQNHEIMERHIMAELKKQDLEGVVPVYIPDEEKSTGSEFRARLVIKNTVLEVMGSWEGNLYTAYSSIFRALRAK